MFEGVRMFTTSLNWLMPTRHWVVDYRRKLRYFGCGKIDGYTSLPVPFTLGCPVTYINVINCDSSSAMLILVRRGRLEIRDEISGLRLTPHTHTAYVQMFELPAVPTHIKSINSVPSVFKHMYDFLEGDDESHFELDDELAEKVNRVVHHPEIHNYPLGDNLHHLKFNYGLHDHGGVAHRTELLLHTELMSNNTIVNLYKVTFCLHNLKKNQTLIKFPHTIDVPSERVLLDTLRIELGGKIERFDVTDHIDAIGEHGLLVEVANGESDHLRCVFFQIKTRDKSIFNNLDCSLNLSL